MAWWGVSKTGYCRLMLKEGRRHDRHTSGHGRMERDRRSGAGLVVYSNTRLGGFNVLGAVARMGAGGHSLQVMISRTYFPIALGSTHHRLCRISQRSAC